MSALESDLASLAAETGFSGVVRVDGAEGIEVEKAYGLADRSHGVANAVDTRFAIASGSKAFTALVVVSLIEDGTLELSTRARSILGHDLPLVGDDVTIEQLLSHRSGIGDYLDEDVVHDFSEYLIPVPVHELATTEEYLAVLGGHPAKFGAGERFSYCNGGYVILALIAERAAQTAFHELVRQRVCAPARMEDTEYFRSDELPGRTARGYLDEGLRSNVFHLPVRGNGDGGVYTTVADIHTFWRALFAGAIVPSGWVDEMVRPRSDVPANSMRYGLGFWLHASAGIVVLEGADAGVSFRSEHDPGDGRTRTVISNATDGAWPLARALRLGPTASA